MFGDDGDDGDGMYPRDERVGDDEDDNGVLMGGRGRIHLEKRVHNVGLVGIASMPADAGSVNCDFAGGFTAAGFAAAGFAAAGFAAAGSAGLVEDSFSILPVDTQDYKKIYCCAHCCACACACRG